MDVATPAILLGVFLAGMACVVIGGTIARNLPLILAWRRDQYLEARTTVYLGTIEQLTAEKKVLGVRINNLYASLAAVLSELDQATIAPAHGPSEAYDRGVLLTAARNVLMQEQVYRHE